MSSHHPLSIHTMRPNARQAHHPPPSPSQPFPPIQRSRTVSGRRRRSLDRASIPAVFKDPLPSPPIQQSPRDNLNATPVSSVDTTTLESSIMDAKEEGCVSDEWRAKLPQAEGFKRFARIIVLLGTGTSSMDQLKEIAAEGNEERWKEFKLSMFNRVANVNVVSGLVTGTTVAMLSNAPPSPIARWTHTVAYSMMEVALYSVMISIGCGTFLLFVLTDSRSSSFRGLARSPWRFWPAMWLLASPAMFSGLSASASILAMCEAVWSGNNTFAKVMLTITSVVTGLMISIFIVIVF
ncbi:hypothetical protein JAAARDRAFT_210820 [Jaapia argillacea MUCL 33604]|uniref:Uncharacterized protein n=1 Tax=Jaapia argillacea MUCL 33604 TaxID=933084 RepID=A0A067PNE2_9AGAM|nr:hypothetical protein JAAARDRAFT_210820 [Jaapia argillacea MUCL 33604]